MTALSVGEAVSRVPSRGDQARLMTGQCPGCMRTRAQLVDGRVASESGSMFQTSTQLWQATARAVADIGLNDVDILFKISIEEPGAIRLAGV